jgi:hypothetical protein
MRSISKLLLLLCLLITGQLVANTTSGNPDNAVFASVQVIHNAPDPGAASVDIYINGVKRLDNFAFRTASPFVDVDATAPVTIVVAPSTSQSAADGLATFAGISLQIGQRYVVVANGVLNPSAFQGVGAAGAFNLNIITPALDATSGAAGTFSFAAMHGSPDAPAVDIFVNNGPTAAINNLTYPTATPYITLPATTYQLGIAASADSTNVLVNYAAPLGALNAAGVSAGVVLASGFLNPANVTGTTNAFGLWAAAPGGGPLVQLPQARDVFVQIVHNSPDTSLRVADILVNGQPFLNNVPFRTATQFVTLKGNIPYTIGIKPGNTNEAPREFTVTLENDKRYVVTATGLWNPAIYAGVGATDFLSLNVIEPGLATGTAGTFTTAIQHGSPDAPTVDITAGIPAAVAVQDLAYKASTPYLPLPVGDYLIGITPANDNSAVVAEYYADLNALNGQAGVVFASGFLSVANSFANAPFGLWVALPSGGPLVPLAQVGRAEVQFVHNSPDPAAASVDVYINGELAADNFNFRTASAYTSQRTNFPNRIAIAAPNSSSAANPLLTFEDVVFETGKRYVVSVNGVVNPSAFAGVPAAANIQTIVIEPAQIAAPAGQFALAVVHGSPDAPEVDVVVDGTPQPLIQDLQFGEATEFLNVPSAAYQLNITPGNDNLTIVKRYRAPLNGLPVTAATVFASGFLNPANVTGTTNAFGLWAAAPGGGPLIQLPEVRDVFVQIVHNAPDTTLRQVDVFVNGNLTFNNFAFRTATGFLTLRGNTPYKIGIKPANTNEAPKEFDVIFENDKRYVVTASGIWNPAAYSGVNAANVLVLNVIEPAIASGTTGSFTTAIQHGSPDAPTVDITLGIPAAVGVQDLAYNVSTAYLPLPVGDALIGITPANDNATVVAEYYADLNALNGQAGVVYASGFLGAANAFANAPFGLWVALPSGGQLVQLAQVGRAQVQFVHNSPDPLAASVDVYVNGVLQADNFNFRTASAYTSQRSNFPNRIAVCPPNSSSAGEALLTFEDVAFETDKRYVVSVNGVVNPAAFTGVPANATIQTIAIEPASIAAPAGQFAVAVVHGSPDAPEVDVAVNGTPLVLVQDIAFGEATEFSNVPAATYLLNITPSNDNSTIVKSYRAPLDALPVTAATVFASGFLNTANQTGTTNQFGLWVAIPAGGALIPLEEVDVATNDLLNTMGVKAWPNPTNQNFNVQYNLPESGSLTISLVDVRGAEMIRVERTRQMAGEQVEQFDLSQLPEGVYFLRMQTANSQGTLRVVVTR